MEEGLTARSGPSHNEESGYYTVWWTDGAGSTYFSNITANSYMMTWSGDGNSMGGKGWNPGTGTRKITYTGTYKPNVGSSYLAVYGWTHNPLIEYYIVESYGSYDPSTAAQIKGTTFCDGANYDVLSIPRINQGSIDGIRTFSQFWSVRNPKKALGAHSYQVVLVEAYFSNGTAQIFVDV